ncbi:hypothetical protein QI045_05180 [Staphylococcus saprophyticus]|uniref:hypothetical protein n=1 Tax=Staphylococcus TaxID=1279 RepID=UPI000D1F57B8|nr:hypothetical protein [Staphylococcus saprophyticus]PTI73725.1 hypothetical protein BU064_13260 [Staphylococcus succinus]MBF2779949.1 hypothetical protein [Staphylococcus saprophyticus]MDW3797391.1 hypothetical protein [Staphylococcus saprophyticus]MDW3872199.1 hypothetical protein [Staphylococcus saprophyticus]MDW4025018.1 hypothetical protein [Staphylococcus saprophyticus]
MLKRNRKIIVYFIIVFIILFVVQKINLINVNQLIENKDYSSYLESIISFSSFTTAFLFFSVSLIPVLNKGIKFFKEFDMEYRILEDILINSFMFLIVTLSTLVLYFLLLIDYKINQFVFTLWLTLLIVASYLLTLILYSLIREVGNKIGE